ncbi:MAG: 2-C-methyl-D-erythritol 4-phosphate cytidylyltransferase [Dehalococcoidia bacterium]
MEESAAAIVLAAGSSRRMGQDKILLSIAGRPLLAYALDAFETCDKVDQVVVVLSSDNAADILPLLSEYPKVVRTCMGGRRRQDSVRAGLHTIAPREWVVVHDGARPLVTPELIQSGIKAAAETGAASAALPVVETLKEADSLSIVRKTVSRDRLWTVQTPQVFRYDLLLRAHNAAIADVTDDCALVEQIGVAVKLFPGSRANLKVTTPEDIAIVEAIIHAQHPRRRTAPRHPATKSPRTSRE